jgi:hypothetical protein
MKRPGITATPLAKAAKERSEFAQRLGRARIARQRVVDQRRSEEAAQAIATCRAERAKRIAAGKPVAPTIDEWREGRRAPFTVMGDLS